MEEKEKPVDFIKSKDIFGLDKKTPNSNTEAFDRTNDIEAKYYNGRSIFVASMIGGPIAAGWLMAKNFKAVNKGEFSMATNIISMLLTIAIIYGVFQIPEEMDVPNMMIPIMYSALYILVFNMTQDKLIEERLTDKKEYYPLLYAIVSAIVIGLLTGLALYLVVDILVV